MRHNGGKNGLANDFPTTTINFSTRSTKLDKNFYLLTLNDSQSYLSRNGHELSIKTMKVMETRFLALSITKHERKNIKYHSSKSFFPFYYAFDRDIVFYLIKICSRRNNAANVLNC